MVDSPPQNLRNLTVEEARRRILADASRLGVEAASAGEVGLDPERLALIA